MQDPLAIMVPLVGADDRWFLSLWLVPLVGADDRWFLCFLSLRFGSLAPPLHLLLIRAYFSYIVLWIRDQGLIQNYEGGGYCCGGWGDKCALIMYL